MNDPYRVSIGHSARKDLSERLPESVAAAAAELIYGDLAANPQRVGKALLEPFAGQHSARRGTFRVTYRINEDARAVEILAVKHRRDAYRSH